MAQCGEVDSNAQKLRLLVHSLIGAAFSWFINLLLNLVRDWSDMERVFHEHFYQTNKEITVAKLARMSQMSSEMPVITYSASKNVGIGAEPAT